MNAFHGDGYLLFFISPLHSSSSSSSSPIEQQHQPILPLVFLFFSIFFLCFVSVSLYKKLKKTEEIDDESSSFNFLSTMNKIHQTHQNKNTHSLFVQILTFNPQLGSLFASFCSHFSVRDNGEVIDDRISNGLELDKDGSCDSVGEDCGKSVKKKKKRAKKKRRNSQAEDGGEEPSIESGVLVSEHKHCLDCLYPFTSSASATQRKIKQQYDQLVKSHDSKGLTMEQVGQFVNCLVEARNELKHKSEVIQRKFTIAKALLLKADRSSFDRLSQQLYKLEAEQKRVEEDASVYNRLQQQLKLSPAYKKMLEIGASMELKASSRQLVESTDTDFADISFEELLAQEKKDTFWQKNGKLRSCVN